MPTKAMWNELRQLKETLHSRTLEGIPNDMARYFLSGETPKENESWQVIRKIEDFFGDIIAHNCLPTLPGPPTIIVEGD